MAGRFNETIPIYLQIIEDIKFRILSGVYKTDDKIPAVRDLALEYGVNPNTVQKAFTELERDGLLQSRRTSGRYVTIDSEKIEQMKKEASCSYIRDLFEKMNRIGISNEETKKIIGEWEDQE